MYNQPLLIEKSFFLLLGFCVCFLYLARNNNNYLPVNLFIYATKLEKKINQKRKDYNIFLFHIC